MTCEQTSHFFFVQLLRSSLFAIVEGFREEKEKSSSQMSLHCVTIISGVEKEQTNPPHDDDDHDDFEEVCIIITIIGIYRKSPSLKLATSEDLALPTDFLNFFLDKHKQRYSECWQNFE